MKADQYHRHLVNQEPPQEDESSCSVPNVANVADHGARLVNLDAIFPDAGEAETDADAEQNIPWSWAWKREDERQRDYVK